MRNIVVYLLILSASVLLTGANSSNTIPLIDINDITLPTTLELPSSSMSFLDPCNTLGSLWLKANWPIKDSRGYFTPANVSATNGYFNLTLRANTWEGAEIYTSKLFSYGRLRASFKCPNVSGAISSLFYYQGKNANNDEIDVEVYENGSRWRIDFVVWQGGRKTWTGGFYPTFNPSAALHKYSIEYSFNGITFFVDGQNKYQFPNGSPTKPIQMHLNCWWPNWLVTTPPSIPPTTSKSMQIDFISYQ